MIFLGNQCHYLLRLIIQKITLHHFHSHYQMKIIIIMIKHSLPHFLIELWNLIKFFSKFIINYLLKFDFLLSIAIFLSHLKKYQIQLNLNDQAFFFSNLLNCHYCLFESTIILALILQIYFQAKILFVLWSVYQDIFRYPGVSSNDTKIY